MNSAFTYLPHRSVLSLSGPDTIVLLERLVTNATTDWPEGEARYGALLTPQGKVIADFLALRTESGVLLDVATIAVETLAKRLKMFRLRSDAQIEIREDLKVLAGLEPAGGREAGTQGAVHVFLDPRYEPSRQRMLTGVKDISGQSLAAYHADRIESCVPEQGFDFAGSDVFPSDINMDLLGGVALNKGCFVGQEVVSRMHRRGKIRRRTVCLSGAELEAGAELMADTSLGKLTSVEGRHALAQVRTDRLAKALEAGTPLMVKEHPVTLDAAGWLEKEIAGAQLTND